MSHIEVILEDLDGHPCCPHGPTILFCRNTDGVQQRFYACAACRDRKDCSFHLNEDEKDRMSHEKRQRWRENCQDFIKGVDHRKVFLTLNKIKQIPERLRKFCFPCNEFMLENQAKHKAHKVLANISDRSVLHPSELLPPLENAKKEAQFLFSEIAVTSIVAILKELSFKNIICIGAPRIHEYISEQQSDWNTILLDIDKRFHSFFGPLEFCWYNMFNHHFFLPQSQKVFEDFLQNDGGSNMVLIMDPPFGGRVELLAQTIRTITGLHGKLNKSREKLAVFFIFPYFMEPQILNSLPYYTMVDYKVDYDNHPLFQRGPRGRKLGSPVRIFTNVDPSLIKLPAQQGYKHCPLCDRWVSVENEHCEFCDACTSKDGRTYVHCNACERCVKPTWIHCSKCNRCAQPDHKCENIPFLQTCFHCKEPGHKKRDCPKVNHEELHRKRKKGIKTKSKKMKKK